MFITIQGYNKAGQTAYAMDSLRWIADYFVKNHHSALAFTAHIGDVGADHSSWGRPEDMTMYRPSWDVTPQTPGKDSSQDPFPPFPGPPLLFPLISYC